jgi:CheY-like chemotaxis protein
MRPDLLPKKHHKRILVVDDEPEFRGMLQRWLESLGYEVLLAANGVEALVQLKEHHPHLVLLDIKMPLLDGWAVLQAMRADEAFVKTPVIMLTAHGEMDSLLESQRMHANDFFIKPFKLEELLEFMRRYL